jgi:hypothetical protein
MVPMRMDLLRACAALGAAGAVVVGVMVALPGSSPVASARPPAALPRTEIAIVATAHDGDARESDVRIVGIDAKGPHETRLATIAHARGAVLRGDVVRGARAFVVAADDERDRGLGDFGSTLWRVDAAASRATELARGLYHASRPLASNDGAIYVERGKRGAWPTAEEARSGVLRVDALSIDAIDPTSGAIRTVYTWAGYTLHIAGEYGAELIVYRVEPRGADLVAIDRATGRSRVVTTLAPFARDFSIDGARGAIVMSNRDDKDAHMWLVVRVDLASGDATRIASVSDDAPAPFALPGGALAFTAPGRGGLSVIASPSPASNVTGVSGVARLLAPLGAGFDAVTSASNDATWITIAHVPKGEGAYDMFAAVHVASGTPVRLTTRDERVEVLGFLGRDASGNGGAR